MIVREGKVECVTGDLGAGKSALAVWRGFNHLVFGGTVFTNIEVYPDKIRERMIPEGLEFDPSRLINLRTDSLVGFESMIHRGTKGNPVMVLLDEAQFDFDAGEKKKWEKQFLQFLALCRKLHICVVFLCHNMMELSIGIRRKITVETVCRNLKEERIAGLGIPLDLYFTVSFKVMMGVSKHKVDSDWYFRLPAWGLYNSYALLGEAAERYAALPEAAGGKLRKLKNPEASWSPAIAAAAAAFLCVI